MRIGIDAHHLNGKPQGSRTYLIELIKSLSRVIDEEDDDELLIFSFEPERTRDLVLVNGVHHRVFPRSARLRIPLIVPLLELVHRVDVFHSQYIAPPLSFVPEVVTIHDVLFETHPELFVGAFSRRSTELIRRSARRARAVLTVSEFSKRAIIERYGIPDERVVVTANAVDHARFRPMDPAPRDVLERYGLEQPFVLSVGRLEPRKNLERLIDAFSRLGGDTTLALVGVADFRYQSILDKIASTDRVKHLGAVSDEDLPALYNLAEALAYPSLAEGFGMPVLEAMACGTPVMTSRCGALPEVAGDAAVYVEPESEEAIGHGLVQVLEKKELRATLRKRGLARASAFDWSETAKGTLEAYRRAL